jgi:Na+-translocating ferredoxin:NAD+ oxidoreductase RnfD subunit
LVKELKLRLRATQVDPFVRNCLLIVLLAAVPALALGAVYPSGFSQRTATLAALSYAVVLAVSFVAIARQSPTWRLPVGFNIAFFLLIGMATHFSYP